MAAKTIVCGQGQELFQVKHLSVIPL